MLPKRHRMTRADFDTLRSSQRRAKSSGFRVALVPRKSGTSAFSVVVPKKSAASAASRNRLRRRAYRVLAELWAELNHPLLGALYASAEATHLSYEELRSDIRALLSRAGAFRPKR